MLGLVSSTMTVCMFACWRGREPSGCSVDKSCCRSHSSGLRSLGAISSSSSIQPSGVGSQMLTGSGGSSDDKCTHIKEQTLSFFLCYFSSWEILWKVLSTLMVHYPFSVNTLWKLLADTPRDVSPWWSQILANWSSKLTITMLFTNINMICVVHFFIWQIPFRCL